MDRYTVNLYSDAKVYRTEQGFETSHGRSHGKITRDYRWSPARMVYLNEQKTIEFTFPTYSNEPENRFELVKMARNGQMGQLTYNIETCIQYKVISYRNCFMQFVPYAN